MSNEEITSLIRRMVSGELSVIELADILDQQGPPPSGCEWPSEESFGEWVDLAEEFLNGLDLYL